MRRSELLIAFVISFISILGTPHEAYGQGGTIRGRIADSTGMPIAQAVVALSVRQDFFVRRTAISLAEVVIGSRGWS